MWVSVWEKDERMGNRKETAETIQILSMKFCLKGGLPVAAQPRSLQNYWAFANWSQLRTAMCLPCVLLYLKLTLRLYFIALEGQSKRLGVRAESAS